MGDTGADLFEVEATGGLFYTGTGEDFESDATQFELTVRANDGVQTSDAAVTVNVTDVPEDDPLIAQLQLEWNSDLEWEESLSEPAGEDFPADITTAGRLIPGDSVTGEIGQSGDVDWYAVELRRRCEFKIELKGSATGDGTLTDPELDGVYSVSGNWRYPGSGNTDGGEGTNAERMYLAGQTETHFVAVSGRGTKTGTYRLSLGRPDCDTHLWGPYPPQPFITAPPDASEPWSKTFPEDTATAGRISVNGSTRGNIWPTGDVDWFAVTLVAGRTYRIDVEGRPTGTGTLVDPYLRGVYDSNGSYIDGTTSTDIGPGLNSQLYFTASAAGPTMYRRRRNESGVGQRKTTTPAPTMSG